MSDDDVISGPWRATRLWNEIVRSFHSGMPCKRHRVRLKTVENCFSGAEAIDWLHKNLKKNPNFGQDVTKEQTVQLLQKILRAGIVECAHSSSSGSQNSLFGMASTGSDGTFVTSDLYRFVDSAAENLRTPGKNKSPVASRISSRREALAAMDNTPLRRGGGGGARSNSEESKFRETVDTESNEWDTKSDTSGLKNHRRRSMMAAMDCPVVPAPQQTSATADGDKRSYFQSLPPNSLIILDNDQTWREAFESQLGSNLSAVHVRNLDINVTRIIYNMTKVSSKGVVQLLPPSGMTAAQSDQDLPHWVLSAMKCLANWPKPMRMINGGDSSLPNYPGFIRDVFDVVKDYFLALGAPLIPYDLFDMFESAYVKAESVKARAVPLPSLAPVSSEYQRYLETDLDGAATSSPQLQTSTPTLQEEQSNRHHHQAAVHPKFYMMRSDSSDAFLNLDGERVARVRQTQEVMPPQMSNVSRASSVQQGSTFDSTGNTTTSASLTLNADMSTTAIMRNFLPPNTCFETVFMNEVPVTRIVPQKQNDTLHLTCPASRSHSRASSYTPIPTAWDTRSIATQTRQEEQQQTRSRQPRWRRSSRLRKSIAVMDASSQRQQQTDSDGGRQPPARSASANEISPILTPNPARTRSSSCCRGDYGVTTNPNGGGGMTKAFSSVDNLLEPAASEEDARFLRKYQRMSLCSARDSQASLLERDNVIMSKAVRKEKRRQREKRESGVGCSRAANNGQEKVYAEIRPGPSSSEYSPNSTSSSSNYAYSRRAPSVRYSSSRFNHLTVKTPLNPIDFPADMQYVRAEPYRQDGDAGSGGGGGGARELSAEGVRSAVDSFKLLGLLLKPASRRKLQLLLKFMKRVSGNDQLTLRRDSNNFILVLDLFVRTIIRPEVQTTNYDGEISRKIVEFFIKNYEAIWTPPESLRREVEEKVYQSLVSKRIRAGKDPYPITYCRQVTSTEYESDKREGARAALLDLLDHILFSEKLSEKEKKRKLKKFKASYPEIYRTKFPSVEDEPGCMRQSTTGNTSALARLSSLSRLKNVIRI